ncbi:MAG: bifunctional methionine sulfoxide reductase B/A protein [Verrucomicrobia bacterium]|nr:bifunctional methionine sulfoxide reductase B/A protein [Verrucomicrobiota bacterium]MBU1734070.1 bifunctional methionine sulfoxide reductase B/A protein [Verrucomicrobiota bacterium]MBU1855720.1 bifunctional methionine sulfoxide reductase B/A protein [Verrucomicrobiota bacterium]
MNQLTPQAERVIVHKGTEAPFSGEYNNFHGKGTYVCRRCGAELYRSDSKFDSGCGWPSFDDEIPGAVRRQPDADGMRIEILCVKCGAHLGHVFSGERLTPKNTRHCVNSISLKFVPDDATSANNAAAVPTATKSSIPLTRSAPDSAPKIEMAIFAGGCFWGVEYYFKRAKGVLSTQAGYMGGHTDNPTYKQVCSGMTGHTEAVRVTYDPAQTTYESMAKLFFEIHDPTQVNRQGPDIGTQYRSIVFYQGDQQKAAAEKLIGILKAKGYNVATQVVPADTFWPAEDYHQQYYEKNGKSPYCHVYKKRF